MKHIINQLNNVLCEGAPQYNTDSRNTETFSLLALASYLLAYPAVFSGIIFQVRHY